MNSVYLGTVGTGGGTVRVAHPAASTSSPTATASLVSHRIARLFRCRSGQPFDETPPDVCFDHDAAVGRDMADHAGHPVQPHNLLAVEILAAVEGNRNPSRVQRKARRNHLQQFTHPFAGHGGD